MSGLSCALTNGTVPSAFSCPTQIRCRFKERISDDGSSDRSWLPGDSVPCTEQRMIEAPLLSSFCTTSDSLDRERFRRHAQILDQLKGQTTPSLLDPGTSDDDMPGLLWFAVQWIAYPDLRSHVASHGPLPALEALVFGVSLLKAIECLHRLDVAHRDLSSGKSCTIPLPLQFAPLTLYSAVVQMMQRSRRRKRQQRRGPMRHLKRSTSIFRAAVFLRIFGPGVHA